MTSSPMLLVRDHLFKVSHVLTWGSHWATLLSWQQVSYLKQDAGVDPPAGE